MYIVSNVPGATKLRRSGMCKIARSASVMPPRWGLESFSVGAGYRHVAPPGLAFHTPIRLAPGGGCDDPEAVAFRAVHGRGEPQALCRHLAFKLLKDAAQTRALWRRQYREAVPVVLCAGFSTDFGKGNRGARPSGCGNVRRADNHCGTDHQDQSGERTEVTLRRRKPKIARVGIHA